MNHFKTIVITFLIMQTTVYAQDTIKVNALNFVRAETDTYFKSKVEKGAFGKFHHEREIVSIDNQYVVRMNRDTRYSYAIFDLETPVTITKPETEERFQSMIVLNQNSYIKNIVYKAGEYTFTKENIGSRYVQIVFRTLVNANSKEDNEMVSNIQNRISAQQKTIGKFETPNWDKVSLDHTRKLLLALAKDLNNSKGMFGDENEVDKAAQLFGTAAGFGGAPERASIYLNFNPKQNDGNTAYSLTVEDVPVDGFWSVCVYNKEGYFEKNDEKAYSFNNITAKKNKDGSITINFGGDKNQINHLPIVDGWNYMVRLYQPREEILNGTWKFPDAGKLK